MHPNLDPDFATKLLRPPDANDNKYTRGVVGFVTGSDSYPGAALLGISAAFEVEIGMACYLGPTSVGQFILSNRPEVVLGVEKADVLVIGSGVAAEDPIQVANLISAAKLSKPMVVDALALQLIDFQQLKVPFILTPHVGEAERLFARLGRVRQQEDILANTVASAQELADLTGGVVLLKGSVSILACSAVAPIESGPGSPHLATAGTGDLLAGLIGALSAKFVASGEKLTSVSFRDIALVANQTISEAAELAADQGEFGASAIGRYISNVINPRDGD